MTHGVAPKSLSFCKILRVLFRKSARIKILISSILNFWQLGFLSKNTVNFRPLRIQQLI